MALPKFVEVETVLFGTPIRPPPISFPSLMSPITKDGRLVAAYGIM